MRFRLPPLLFVIFLNVQKSVEQVCQCTTATSPSGLCYDSRYQADTLDEAIASFPDLSTGSDQSGAGSCVTKECLDCQRDLVKQLKKNGLLQPDITDILTNQINDTSTCKKYRFSNTSKEDHQEHHDNSDSDSDESDDDDRKKHKKKHRRSKRQISGNSISNGTDVIGPAEKKMKCDYELLLSRLTREEIIKKAMALYNENFDLKQKIGVLQMKQPPRAHRNVVYPPKTVAYSTQKVVMEQPVYPVFLNSFNSAPSSSSASCESEVARLTTSSNFRANEFESMKNSYERRIQDEETLRFNLHKELGSMKEKLDSKTIELALEKKVSERINAEIYNLRELNEAHRKSAHYFRTAKSIKSKNRIVIRIGKAYNILRSNTSQKNRVRQGIALLRRISGNKNIRKFFIDSMKQLGKDTGCDFSPKLSVKDALMLATKCGFTQQDLNVIKRVLKKCLGFDVFPSKALLDQMAKEYAKAENMDVRLEKDGADTIEISELKNLKEVLSQRLTELSASGRLQFEDSTKGNIWFAILGDKGDVTSKLVGVIANVRNANSCFHLIPLGTFTANETAENYMKYLPSIIGELNKLEDIEYEENGAKKVRQVVQFLGGDLKFMHEMMGHRGCTSPEFCIWCHEKYTRSIKIASYDKKTEPLRTRDDYERDFLTGDNSVKKGGMVVFKLVKMNQLIPPSLHIILGLSQRYIFNVLLNFALKADNTTDEDLGKISTKKTVLKKLNKNIEDFEQQIVPWKNDVNSLICMKQSLENGITGKINKSTEKPCGAANSCVHRDRIMSPGNKKTGTPYQCYGCQLNFHSMCIGVWNEDDRIKHEDVEELLQCFQCQKKNSTDVLRIVKKQIVAYQKYVADLEAELAKKKEDFRNAHLLLKKGQGIHRKALEAAWKKHGADMSVWKQDFTGNHVHSLLQDSAINDMFLVFEESQSAHIDDDMRQSFFFLRQAAEHLRIIQSLCTSDFLDDGAIDMLEQSKHLFFQMVQKALPTDTVTCKMHVLLKHVIPYAREHQTLAKISEQSIESYHAFFSRIERRYICARNPLIRMRFVFKSLLLHNQLTDSFL